MTLIVGTNAYISRADADAYFAGRLHSTAWTGTSEANRDAALRMATKAIDRLAFGGRRALDTQALAWPRVWVRDGEGRILPAGEVPGAVREACCEWALHMLQHDPAARPADIARRKVGDLEVEYRPGARDRLPPTVRELLAPFLRGDAHSAPMVL